MENSKSAERWALVTAMPSLPCDLDLKVKGGIGGKTVPQERRTLGLGTSSDNTDSVLVKFVLCEHLIEV